VRPNLLHLLTGSQIDKSQHGAPLGHGQFHFVTRQTVAHSELKVSPNSQLAGLFKALKLPGINEAIISIRLSVPGRPGGDPKTEVKLGTRLQEFTL
jgi:hypothetical protein